MPFRNIPKIGSSEAKSFNESIESKIWHMQQFFLQLIFEQLIHDSLVISRIYI